MRRHKFNAKATVVDGIRFHSLAEAGRYGELKLLERAGVITDLVLQPKLVICEAATLNGKRLREIAYYADFSYFDREKGEVVYEDVKGYDTPVSKLKRRIVLDKYGIDIKIVKR